MQARPEGGPVGTVGSSRMSREGHLAVGCIWTQSQKPGAGCAEAPVRPGQGVTLVDMGGGCRGLGDGGTLR